MKCKLTSNLHQIGTSILQTFQALAFVEKTCFSFHIVIVLKNIKHILPGIDFSVLMSRNLMAGKPRVMQNNWIVFFPRHRFEIREGPSDWLTVGRIALFVLNKFGKTTPLVMHWLWVVGAILSIISRLGNPHIGKILDVTTLKNMKTEHPKSLFILVGCVWLVKAGETCLSDGSGRCSRRR